MRHKTITLLFLTVLSITLTACTLFDKPDEETPTTTTASETTEQTFSGKLSSLFGLNQNLKCNISGSEDFTGEIYVSENKVRGNFKTGITNLDESQTLESYLISDGEWVYTWSSAFPTGIKMKTSDWENEDVSSEVSDEDIATPEELKADFNYECEPWSVDNTVFDIPTNVTFNDMSQYMEDFSDIGCQACDLITDSTAKQACKTRLSC